MYRMLLCNEDLTRKIKKYLFLNKRKIFYLPSAVNTNFYKPRNKKAIRKKLKLNQKDQIIIYTGRISYLKGSDFLFKIIKNNPDKKFILIGEILDKDYTKTKLKNIIHLKGINDKKMADYCSAADLGLFLSRTEGNPFSTREVMACETPVIVSDIEGVRLYAPAIKVPFKVKKIQEEIDNFFKLSEKEKNKLSKETREYIK